MTRHDPGGDVADDSIHDTWVRVADDFDRMARRVPDDRWDAPAPPEGWTTRDVVRHLVEWVPALLRDGASVEITPGPSVDEDPVGAWRHFADQVEQVLADPQVHQRLFSHGRAGDHPLDEAIQTFVLGDVVMHTWDLAKGGGLDVVLDPAVVHSLVEGLRPMGDFLEKSGQYGPAVPTPPGASEQDELIGLIGRDPGWTPPPPESP
jgi:uncharacterized protein (TIGR03086 family)